MTWSIITKLWFSGIWNFLQCMIFATFSWYVPSTVWIASDDWSIGLIQTHSPYKWSRQSGVMLDASLLYILRGDCSAVWWQLPLLISRSYVAQIVFRQSPTKERLPQKEQFALCWPSFCVYSLLKDPGTVYSKRGEQDGRNPFFLFSLQIPRFHSPDQLFNYPW